MKIANDDFNNLATATAYAFTASFPWTLSTGDATKAVYVIFRDAAGNWQANNAATANMMNTIILDTAAPGTTITSAPSGTMTSTSASFSFSGSDTNSPLTYECEMDGAGFVPGCSSPITYTVAVGTHTFKVRAKDPAGHVDASPASETWTVSAPPVAGLAVKLYDNAGKTGTMCPFTGDSTTLGACNNIASSIEVPAGYVATVYPDSTFDLTGGQYCSSFDSSVSFPSGDTLNNVISAIKIWSSMDGVMLYLNAGLAGISDYFGDSMTDISSGKSCVNWNSGGLGLPASAVSSLKLKSGYGVTLYENPGYKNGCRTFFQTNVDNLDSYTFGDKARSFKLWKSGFNGAILYDDKNLYEGSNNEYYAADGVKKNLGISDCVYQKAESIKVSPGNVAFLYYPSLDSEMRPVKYPAPGKSLFSSASLDNSAKHIKVCPQTSTSCLTVTEDSLAQSVFDVTGSDG
ncbi:MAG: hypothetical protein HY365_00495, partial [Candidatus Aenigmarchaeota archaeon]|nr:hypothetical protein [Candidatus Aenigmarchaeota archaeon]